CFTPEEFRTYEITLTAVDDCGAADSVTVEVIVDEIPKTAIECPESPIGLCEAGPHEIAIPIVGSEVTVTTSMGTYENGNLVVTLPDYGKYDITVIADGECNSDTCTITLEYAAPAEVACSVVDTSFFLCYEIDSVMYEAVPVTITGDSLTVTVSPSTAYYEDGLVYVPVHQGGSYTVTVTAENFCSSDNCSFDVNVPLNSPPVVEVGADIDERLCELTEICVPYSATDADDNIIEIRASLGVVNGQQVCFTPETFGEFDIIITAIDDCGETDEDTVHVSLTEGQYVSITCPEQPIFMNVLVPDTVRVPLPISPLDATITVSPNGYYDETAQELVVYVTERGTYDYQIIADAECNSDTCAVELNISEYVPPYVECIGSVDTALCLVEPQTLCLPVTFAGTDVQFEVDAPAYYLDGNVCLEVSEPGDYVINMLAFNDKASDTCVSTIHVTGGNPPIVTMPEAISEDLCDADSICFDVTVEDAEFDVISVTVNLGVYDSQAGTVCFYAETAGEYEIILTAYDGCGNVSEDTTVVTVRLNEAPLVDLGEDFDVFGCDLASEVCVDVDITDNNDFLVETNLGLYNEGTGQVCFVPETAGSYTLIVEVTDVCGAVAADTVIIEVSLNSPPVLAALRDTSVYMCFPTEICIDVDASDIDNNLQSVETSFGTYADGQVCFVPYSSGEYEIIVTATDECGLAVVDTAVVTVRTDQEITLDCPSDTTVFLCEPDTLCFEIGGNIPADAEITVGGIATFLRWYDDKPYVCFYSDCCLENRLSVTVTTECGSYSCDFNVSVQTNSRPLVLLPQDTTIVQCQLGDVCIPVGINDIDGNLLSIAAEGGTYDAYRHEVCFTPDQEGTYEIIVTAKDSCQATMVDTVEVTVKINEAPVISYQAIDTVYKQCAPEEVCVPVGIDDIDDNITSITVEGGTYDAEKGLLCIMPDGLGSFCATIRVVDDCGLIDQQQICIEVALGDFVEIQCPETPFENNVLCETGTVCVDLPVAGTGFTVITDFGTWEAGQVCFQADTSGTYEITAIAEAQCNSDTCTFTVPVEILDPLSITCPENTQEFLCTPDTLCYDFSFGPASAEVTVSAPAFISEGQVCVPVLAAGTQSVILTVTNKCGVDTCSFTVASDFNDAPTIQTQNLEFVECDFFEVCVPVTIADGDNNLTEITTSLGSFNDDTTAVCFTPTEFGLSYIEISATDACGVVKSKTATVNFTEGEYASIVCPDATQFSSICGPDTICILAPVTPADAQVTVLPAGNYNPETGEVCLYVVEGGTVQVTVIAASQCGSDTCNFNLEVDMGIPAQVTCPGDLDTLLCLTEPDTLCLPLEVTGTGVQVNVNPIGFYSAGTVCLPISQAGQYDIEVIAHGTCGADTCDFTVTVTADQAPQLILPQELTFERCPDDEDEICIAGVFATDAESDVTLTMTCGPGTFENVTADSGRICFVPQTFGAVEFCFEASDGCSTVSGSYFVNINAKDDCDVCVRVSIDGGKCTPVGLRKQALVNIETNDHIGGFNLLLGFDPTALSFQTAKLEGGPAEDWEYFTWNLGGFSYGQIRFVGIADRNDGASHPPDSAYNPNGTLIFIDFIVANNQNLGDVFVPLTFLWSDCDDNSFSDTSGTLLYVESRVYNPEGVLIWDEFDDVTYPESNRLAGVGVPDSCIVQDEKNQALRCIEFINGGICIIDPDSIDDRGDVNLNGLSYEIADAVVFTRYFIHGMSAFTINVAGQIAATDVNADGLTLTVSDLVLLIRVVIGDAPPVPKVSPFAQKAQIQTNIVDGQLRITTETHESVGAAYFVFDIEDGVAFGLPELIGVDSEFEVIHSARDNQLHLLLYDIGDAKINAGRNDLVHIPVYGEGEVTLVHSELVDYAGRPYLSENGIAIPTEFTLEQNYPNPFNPTTTISFTLPQSSGWNLRVYNVNGGLVREFSGQNGAGKVEVVWDGRNASGRTAASGVYFYRLEASSFSETRKMILLK
ncbi:MAG: T9SS type A sorting domain-containing protein, partial [bacterium]|nr:T9SS type A sorting domain-containing protein [bacterium]